MTKRTQKLKKEAFALNPTVKIGKEGVTESIIAHIKQQLRTHTVLKVRIASGLLTGVDKRAFAQDMATKSGGILVQQVGFVAVIARKR